MQVGVKLLVGWVKLLDVLCLKSLQEEAVCRLYTLKNLMGVVGRG